MSLKDDFCWNKFLDWQRILSLLDLECIENVPETKIQIAFQNITDFYGLEDLLLFEPNFLDSLVVKELKILLRKELLLKNTTNKNKDIINYLSKNSIPTNRGTLIKIDPRNLKGFTGNSFEDLIKHLSKKFFRDKNGTD